jgi:eukaryotic-like serine/threonine-protein kinase
MTRDTEGRAEELYRFANAEFDARAHELRLDGRNLPIESKALQVLICLLARPGETLTKDELLAMVWPGRVVTEGVLAKAVMKLRAVLGDEGQRIIRTVHGFGYRLGVSVEVLGSEAPALFEPAPGRGVPFRSNWQLVQALDGKRALVWQAEHIKTRDRRVFKFSTDGRTLAALKREITLFRLLHDALGDNAPVVRILDWNLDEPPYFTEAEWVEGGDLGAWIAGEAGTAVRIEAMAQLCEAVAATHALGVVHKDLKPANILPRVDGSGEPRICLVDFGIGALSDRRAIDELGITRLGFTGTQAADNPSSGTPLYLAPEVIAGQMPTQKSDIYALGVILYQMLVGDPRRPLAPGWERDLDDALLVEDIAAAADVDPDRRLGDAAELARRLRSLDARRDQRRAEVEARQEAERLRQALQRTGKRRRRLAWFSAALLAVLTVVSFLAVEMRLAQDQARIEANTAAAVNDFLIQDLLGQANPMIAGRSDVGVREVLDVAAAKVGSRFADRPASEAAVRLALGSAYRNLAAYDNAALELEAALGIARAQVEAHRLLAPISIELGALRIHQDRPLEAMALLEPLLAHADATLAARAATTLARAAEKAGDYQASMDYTEFALERAEPGSALAASALGQQGITLVAMGRHAEAVEINRNHLDVMRSLNGENDIRNLEATRSTALSLYYADRFAESLEVYEDAYRLAADSLGVEHDQTLVLASDIALLHQELGDLERAERMMRATLETRIARYGEGSRDVRTLLNNLGVVYGELGDRERELTYLRRAWEAEVSAMGESHPDALVSAHNVGRALLGMGRHAEAEPLQRHTVGLAIETFGADHPYVGIMSQILARIIAHLGQFDEAERLVADAIVVLENGLGADNGQTERARAAETEIRRLKSRVDEQR